VGFRIKHFVYDVDIPQKMTGLGTVFAVRVRGSVRETASLLAQRELLRCSSQLPVAKFEF